MNFRFSVLLSKMKIWNLKLKLQSNTAKVDSDYPLENFPEWKFMSRNQNHGQNPLPSYMEHFSEIYGTVREHESMKPHETPWKYNQVWKYETLHVLKVVVSDEYIVKFMYMLLCNHITHIKPFGTLMMNAITWKLWCSRFKNIT